MAKSKADVLHEHLKGVVEGLLCWQSDTKNSFKAKVSACSRIKINEICIFLLMKHAVDPIILLLG